MVGARQNTSGTAQPRTRWTRTVVVLLISLGLAMVGLLTLGLPGAIVLQAAIPFAEGLFSARLGGDQVWPAALAISALGPFALLPADLVSRRTRWTRGATLLLTAVLALLVNVVVTVAGIVLGAA